MPRIKLHIYILILIGLPSLLAGQDADISQTYAAPLYLNPALSGAYEGNFRIGFVYRDQWASLIDNPYKTFVMSGDVRLQLTKGPSAKDRVSAGLLFVSDKVDPFHFSTNSIMVSLAYHKFLDVRSGSYLSAGITGGMNQKNFIYEAFTFQDQFNGVDGYTLASFENLPRNNHAYFDIGIGVHYSMNLNRDLGISAGISMQHLLEPNISFFQEESAQLLTNEQSLKQKFVVHSNADINLGYGLSLQPRLIYSQQGKDLGIMAGSSSRWELDNVVENAFHLGSWARLNQNEGGLSFNSWVFMVGFEVKKILLGISYDLYLQDLSTYKIGQHSFELSISYIGNYEDDEFYCPRF